MRLPVGLLGLATKTTPGRIISIARPIDPTSRSHDASSGTSTGLHPCARAETRYITNVGVGDRTTACAARSRGRDRAVRISAMTSSEPVPTRRSAARDPVRSAMRALSSAADGSG